MTTAALLTLDQLAHVPSNPKSPLGDAYGASLDASIAKKGFQAQFILTPMVSVEETPELAAEWPELIGKYIVADGNTRLDRIPALGYHYCLVFPQPSTDDAQGVLAAYDAIVEAGPELRSTLVERIGAGENIAFGRINPRLVTPADVYEVVLSFDRARARFDEKAVGGLFERLVKDFKVDAKALGTLTVRKSALIHKAVSEIKQKEREAKAAEAKAKRDAAAAEAAQERADAEAARAARVKVLREDAARFPFGPFWLSREGAERFEYLMGLMKTSTAQPGREGRMLGLLEYAVALGGQDATRDMFVEACVEAADRQIRALEAQRELKASKK